MNPRDSWPDFAKGIGIILVVYGHVARGLFGSGIISDRGLHGLIDSVIYSFHMPLFFFLSGIFFRESITKWGPWGLVLRKFDVIFYPYILWSLIQGLIEVLLSKYTNGHVCIDEVFSLLWHPRAQFWFLHTLFTIFLVLSLLNRFLESQKSIALGLSLLLYLFGENLAQNPVLLAFATNLIFFVLGSLFKAYKNRLGLDTCLPFLVGFFGLSFLVSQCVFHLMLGLRYFEVGLCSLILAIVSILFVVFLSMCLSRSNIKVISGLGAASMSIYLMHIMSGSGTRILLRRCLDVDSPAVHLSAGVVLGLALPLAAAFGFRRYKLDFLLRWPRIFSRLQERHDQGVSP